MRCTRCDAPLASAVVCEACGALQAPAAGVDPWAAFGLERGYAIDVDALRKRLHALQRRTHPDFFSEAPAEERELAERATAELNAAFRALESDVRRADLLVRALGGPDDQTERGMPQAFLAEVLEWNETLDDARAAAPGSRERAALDPLERELGARRADALARLAALLAPTPERGAPALAEARRTLNAVRYLDRTRSALAELRLDAARGGR